MRNDCDVQRVDNGSSARKRNVACTSARIKGLAGAGGDGAACDSRIYSTAWCLERRVLQWSCAARGLGRHDGGARSNAESKKGNDRAKQHTFSKEMCRSDETGAVKPEQEAPFVTAGGAASMTHSSKARGHL